MSQNFRERLRIIRSINHFFIRNNFFSNLIHLSNYQKVCKNYKEELLSVSWFLDVMLTVGHQIADTIY